MKKQRFLLNQTLRYNLLLLSGHGFLFAFAGPGIGSGSLPSQRKALSMPEPAVTTYIHKPFNIQGNLCTKAAFYFVIILDKLTEHIQFFQGKIIDKSVGINPCLAADLIGAGPANAKNIG